MSQGNFCSGTFLQELGTVALKLGAFEKQNPKTQSHLLCITALLLMGLSWREGCLGDANFVFCPLFCELPSQISRYTDVFNLE